MNSRAIGALSLAALFAVSMIMVPAYAGGHLGIMDTDIETKTNSNPKNPNERIKVHIEVGADIPVDGSISGFGYAILTESGNGAALSLGKVLVLVTHLPIDDSDHEDPTSGLHTHVLNLIAATSACTSAGDFDLEVDLSTSGDNKGFDLDSDWEVDGNTAWIGFTPTKTLNSGAVEAIVAFTVTPIPDAVSPTNLCVDVVGSGVGL